MLASSSHVWGSIARGLCIPAQGSCCPSGSCVLSSWLQLLCRVSIFVVCSACTGCTSQTELLPCWVDAVWPAPWLLVVDVRGGVAGCSVVGVFSEAVSSQPVKPQQKWLSACCRPCRRNYWLNLFLRIFCSGRAIVTPVTLLRNKLELRISPRLGECLQFCVPMFSSVCCWKQQSLKTAFILQQSSCKPKLCPLWYTNLLAFASSF